jgi:hypothetical protein
MRTEILGPMERIVKIIESLIHDPMAKHHTSNKDDAKHTRKQDKHVYYLPKLCVLNIHAEVYSRLILLLMMLLVFAFLLYYLPPCSRR